MLILIMFAGVAVFEFSLTDTDYSYVTPARQYPPGDWLSGSLRNDRCCILLIRNVGSVGTP